MKDLAKFGHLLLILFILDLIYRGIGEIVK